MVCPAALLLLDFLTKLFYKLQTVLKRRRFHGYMDIWKARFAGGLALLLAAFLASSLKYAFWGLLLGATGGFALEYMGVMWLKLWSYGGQFPKGKALLRLVLSWGLIGMVASLLWHWISIGWLAFFLSFLFPILCWEVPNIRKKSWQYRAPAWMVLAGWLLVLLAFRGVLIEVP